MPGSLWARLGCRELRPIEDGRCYLPTKRTSSIRLFGGSAGKVSRVVFASHEEGFLSRNGRGAVRARKGNGRAVSSVPQSDQFVPPCMARVSLMYRAIFDSFLEQAKASRNRGNLEETASWCSVAAYVASRKGWSGSLASRELEQILLSLAPCIEIPRAPTSRTGKTRWLHVFNEAYGTLGHTNLCRRWIQMDPEVLHDVIVTDQRYGDPQRLVESARGSGGRATILDASRSILERAKALRADAFENADVVVLHAHPEDVISTIAFGVPGGPPVLFANHADHLFWVGVSVADLVLDIRKSGHGWTRGNRGTERAIILPLPLPQTDSAAPSAEEKRKLRRQLGLPEDRTLLLTVGSANKYNPIRDLDFVETAKEILRQCPSACLVAVGPENTGRWKDLSQATGGRVLPVGRQLDSRLYCRAADLYLEGFPAGSLTALLEAAELGLACVRAPSSCAPPFSSDSPGLDLVPQPGSLEDYVREAVALAGDPEGRAELGQNLQQSIRQSHCGDNWRKQLAEVRRRIPTAHFVYPDFEPVPVNAASRDWLGEYLHSGEKVNRRTIATYAFIEAWQRDTGEPRMDASLWELLGRIQDGASQTESKAPLRVWDRVDLWWLNFKIRRSGMRCRLLMNAALAFKTGNRSVARRLTYECVWRQFTCCLDFDWIKMATKAHLGPGWLASLRRLRGR